MPDPSFTCCKDRKNCEDAKTARGGAICDKMAKDFCKKIENKYSDECACFRRPPRDALSNLSQCVDRACMSDVALKTGYMIRTQCPVAVDCVQKIFLIGSGSNSETPATFEGITTEQVCSDGSVDGVKKQAVPKGSVGDSQPAAGAGGTGGAGATGGVAGKTSSALNTTLTTFSDVKSWKGVDWIPFAVGIVLFIVSVIVGSRRESGTMGFIFGVILFAASMGIYWAGIKR